MSLETLRSEYDHAVLTYVDADGYPFSVAASFDVRGDTVALEKPAEVAPASGTPVNLVFSHIRPQPGSGYDERRYVSLWGKVRSARGNLTVTPERQWGWDEQKMPFFQYSEVTVPQAHRYLDDIRARAGREVRPKLSFGWLALRTLRAPFLTATVVPVLLGVAVAARQGSWRPGLALLTFLGAALVHLGLNTANDVFDTMSGADAANSTPTQFSGGSRVVHYGLVSLRGLAILSASLYLGGIAIGFWLAVTRGFWPLFGIGVAGVAISVFYTAPPFRLVHRGVGEIAVALGFGPIMVLGAYYVQAQRFSGEAAYLSVPAAILIALVLYVNEIPDRAGDAAAGKRTLPVRLPMHSVIRLYDLAIGVTYALIAIGSLTGAIARPAAIALMTIPLAVRVSRGLRAHYDSPYELMATMQKNIELHLYTGLLLGVGYVIAAFLN